MPNSRGPFSSLSRLEKNFVFAFLGKGFGNRKWYQRLNGEFCDGTGSALNGTCLHGDAVRRRATSFACYGTSWSGVIWVPGLLRWRRAPTTAV